jgi:TfuA protein
MDPKKIIVFTGPSLKDTEAKKILKADYRPPVARGDVLKALSNNPKIIGIIDGVFHQQPAVSHREILKALQGGITVVGGASMGALRASELDDFGMIGVGNVYKAYKTCEIESDDDVAVVFNPETMELLSEALVSMNFNFKKALERGLISHEEFQILIKKAKTIYYPKRNYSKVLAESGMEREKTVILKEFLDREGTDIKREDAISVLKYIKTMTKQETES